jgi:hypothetical protein
VILDASLCPGLAHREVEITTFAWLVAHIHAVGGSLGGSPIRAADSIARLALAGERFLRGVEEDAPDFARWHYACVCKH